MNCKESKQVCVFFFPEYVKKLSYLKSNSLLITNVRLFRRMHPHKWQIICIATTYEVVQRCKSVSVKVNPSLVGTMKGHISNDFSHALYAA